MCSSRMKWFTFMLCICLTIILSLTELLLVHDGAEPKTWLAVDAVVGLMSVPHLIQVKNLLNKDREQQPEDTLYLWITMCFLVPILIFQCIWIILSGNFEWNNSFSSVVGISWGIHVFTIMFSTF